MRTSEDGFSLVEVAISTLVAVVFFLAFAGSLETSTDSVALSRTHTQAASLASQEIEYARSLAWSALAMSSIDPEAPLLTPGGDALDGSAGGVATDEPLVVDPAGSILPKGTHRSEHTTYTAWTFVTDAGAGMRRVVVLVEWATESEVRRVRSSTLVSPYGALGRGSGTTTTTVAP